MQGRPLNHLELLSIPQKDEQYYSNWIGNDIHELAQRCLGVRQWIHFRNAITVLSRFGYFGLTTLSNIPTPGEEFCEAQPPQPGYLRHLLMVALNNELRLPSEIPKTYVKLIKDVHLVTFFLFGDFFELPKRVTNFFYSTNSTMSTQSKRIDLIYKFLGFVSLAQLVVDITKQSQEASVPVVDSKKQVSQDRIEKKPATRRAADMNMICHLCSERRTEPTSTVCGHIFCWNCIHQWLRERSECPICRTPTEPSRLIHLINFR